MPVYNQSRSRVIQLIFAVIFIVIIAQLLHLQMFSSDLKIQAENNAIFRKVVYPDRGIIYDRKKRAVLENTIMYDLVVTPNQVKGTDTAALCRILAIDTAEFRKRIITAIIKNSYYKPSAFAALVSPDTYARLNENMYKFPGFVLQERPVRTYPYSAAGNVLGYIGEVDTTYLRKHKTEGYEMGDYAGLTGLEATYEPVLMGQRGVKRFIRDNKNRIQGSYENGNYDTAAVAGRNLYTSMDIELQQLAEKLLGSKIGSAVAINPKTGGILAMATSPTYNPNLLTGSERRKNFSQLFLDTARPLLNRAIKGQYPPGSTFKPLGALVALDEGLITPSFGYGCSGAYYSCGRPVKCEHHDAGHAANLRAALSHSCNSYFSQVFRMAIDNPNFSSTQQGYLKWKEYMNAFGLGVRLNIDLPSEDKGNIPDTSKYNRDFAGPRWNSCNILTLGIGQDRMLATPLQLANAMCFIANKGYYYTPHFVDSIENESITDTSYLGKYRTKHKVTNITNDVFDAVQLAMLDVTRSGTAVNAKIDGIDICAKTGTAQNPHGKNHSLFVAFAPMDDPKIAIAVVVENAGFGSTWAAPIASLMMEKYLNDTISAKRLPEVDRISKADLIPAAIKHWYAVKDSIKLAKLAKQIDADKAPVFENTTDNRKHTFDPEAEPNRKENDSTDVSAKDSGIIPKQYQPRKPK
ncbi:penicillin-binding protein 2 [Panacibacter sp. DH6]|uniref:Penicillin-binding protein 2 n=1 Tax=Panacibacter microcysteis TaxID=2793269 RepID=A0A931GVD6_9BACT|nr:penicillin-binding protein 2 [Panacibacter microcysteis]MBG9376285.1 penicillin-binding protein 2 [Panacibacter microcysteis]